MNTEKKENTNSDKNYSLPQAAMSVRRSIITITTTTRLALSALFSQQTVSSGRPVVGSSYHPLSSSVPVHTTPSSLNNNNSLTHSSFFILTDRAIYILRTETCGCRWSLCTVLGRLHIVKKGYSITVGVSPAPPTAVRRG